MFMRLAILLYFFCLSRIFCGWSEHEVTNFLKISTLTRWRIVNPHMYFLFGQGFVSSGTDHKPLTRECEFYLLFDVQFTFFTSNCNFSYIHFSMLAIIFYCLNRLIKNHFSWKWFDFKYDIIKINTAEEFFSKWKT